MTDKYIFELLKNNSFGLDALNSTLWDIKETAFTNLYNAQKSITDVQKVDIDITNFINKKSKYIYNISTEFIRDNQRFLYRKSKFYKNGTELTLSDLYKNPDIFTDIPLLFINGELYTNYTLKISDNILSIIFTIGPQNQLSGGNRAIRTGFTRDEFDTIIYGNSAEKYNKNKQYNIGDLIRITDDDGGSTILMATTDSIVGDYESANWIPAVSKSKMSVVFISNCSTAYESKKFNNYNIHDFYYNLPSQSSPYRGIPMSEFLGLYDNDTHKTDNLMAYMASDEHMYRYRLIDGGKGTYINGSNAGEDIITLSADQINNLTNNIRDTRLFHVINQLDKYTIESTDEYFEIEIQDMPVPVESMLIFRRTENGDIYYDHDTTIELLYPNIYKINRPEGAMFDNIIYVFYSDDTASVGSKYMNELQLYHRFTENLLNKYKSNTIPEFIKSYKPISVTYDIKDYADSNYYSDNNHIQYKLDKFKSLVSQNGEFYRWYLKKIVGYVPHFDINVDDIRTTLGSRIRTDNKKEITDPSLHTIFTERRYLFIFRHGGYNDNFSFTIDNYAYFPDQLYTDDKYVYVYIPIQRIKLDDKNGIYSIIHVEKLSDVTFRKQIIYNDSSDEYIHIPLNIKPQLAINDLFLTHKVNGVEKYLVNTDGTNDEYEIYVPNITDNSLMLINDTSFCKYDDIYIKITDESLKNEELYVVANRININRRLIGDSKFELNVVLNNDPLNISLFKNGKRLPDEAIKIIFNENISGPHTVKSLTSVADTDEFMVSYTQNKYIKVASLDTIPSNGYVDLTDIIQEPIDLDWHDIYINGIKLNENNIDSLTPYSFLMKGINTLKNLVVYRRNLDSAILAPETTNGIPEQIIDNVPGFIDDILDDIPVIDDLLPDIMDDIVTDLVGFLDEYLLTFGLINPDIPQITDDMITKYEDVMDENNCIFINPDDNNNAEKDIFFNPDNEYNLTLETYI